MKALKRFVSVTCALILCSVSLLPIQAAGAVSYEDLSIDDSSIVVLYTSDVHGGISNDFDYSGTDTSVTLAGVAAIKAEAEKDAAAVTLVDVGDALQGSILCSQSSGSEVLSLMNTVGYDYQVFGNHEFDYGMETALSFIEQSNAEYLGVNFRDLAADTEVFPPYAIQEYTINNQTVKIGYVGILTPESIAKGTPKYFQDADGNFIYSLEADTNEQFYATVQTAVDSALAEGADYIIALGHLGNSGVTEGWSSKDVIQNTEGIDVFLDGHAHSVVESEEVTDRNQDNVLLTAVGTKLQNLGALIITLNDDGSLQASSHLINTVSEAEKESESYQTLDTAVKELEDKYSYLMVEEGNSAYDLCIYDPVSEERMIRNHETNLGDYIADAYKAGLNADIGIINGGSIRADLEAGDITFLDITNVLPYTGTVDKIKASGQVILDCLEMGSRLYPEESGGFIQVSGMTYTIDSEMPSSVETDAQGMFVKVNGNYRVKDVKVNGEDLDLEKIYTVAISDYYFADAGDGMTMFSGCELDTEEPVSMIDRDLFISYLSKNGNEVSDTYADVNGEGRITILPLASPAPSAESDIAEQPVQNSTNDEWMGWVTAAVLILILVLTDRKGRK